MCDRVHNKIFNAGDGEGHENRQKLRKNGLTPCRSRKRVNASSKGAAPINGKSKGLLNSMHGISPQNAVVLTLNRSIATDKGINAFSRSQSSKG